MCLQPIFLHCFLFVALALSLIKINFSTRGSDMMRSNGPRKKIKNWLDMQAACTGPEKWDFYNGGKKDNVLVDSKIKFFNYSHAGYH